MKINWRRWFRLDHKDVSYGPATIQFPLAGTITGIRVFTTNGSPLLFDFKVPVAVTADQVIDFDQLLRDGNAVLKVEAPGQPEGRP